MGDASERPGKYHQVEPTGAERETLRRSRSELHASPQGSRCELPGLRHLRLVGVDSDDATRYPCNPPRQSAGAASDLEDVGSRDRRIACQRSNLSPLWVETYSSQ
jgi:hypothetical protein